MPTENRSSNTEMVSVPRETIEQAEKLLQEDNRCTMAREFRTILAKPADQHQGEPVALPKRLPVRMPEGRNLPKGHAEAWNACLTEVEKLGPLYTHPAPADQQEPVEVLGYSVKGNPYAIRLTKGELLQLHEGYTGDALIELVDRRLLDGRADPGEVEQAKAAHRKHAAELIACRTLLREELDTLRAQLAEQDDPCKWTDRQVLDFLGVALRNVDLKGEVRMSEIRQGFQYMRDRAALYASAEPNQCDGCQAGIPLINGAHRMGKLGGYPDAMSCQSHKYASAEPNDECAHSYANSQGCPECGESFAGPIEHTEIDHDALVAAVCVLRSHGLGNLSAAVEEARAALERKPS